MTADFWAKIFMLCAFLASGLVGILIYEAAIRFAADILVSIGGVIQ